MARESEKVESEVHAVVAVAVADDAVAVRVAVGAVVVDVAVVVVVAADDVAVVVVVVVDVAAAAVDVVLAAAEIAAHYYSSPRLQQHVAVAQAAPKSEGNCNFGKQVEVLRHLLFDPLQACSCTSQEGYVGYQYS